MGKWQCKWNAENQKGQWTKRLIKDIEPWVKRNHGDLTYRMTQALTGHGCFGTFLKRIRKVSVDTCKYCPETDTPEHTVFQCVRFDVERRTCCFETECSLTPDNIVQCMLENQQQWNRIARFLERIMLQKEADERTSQTSTQ
uniref:Reverse transcriptase n=1 Tax=Cacopsylla melanoneura TaxID=428564 RepID=A0A8D9FFF7_9HEMI